MDPLTPPSTPPTQLPRYISILAAGLVVGAIIGVFVAPYLPFSTNSNNTYQAGFAAAKNLFENSSIGGAFRTSSDVRTLSGSVTAVSGNQFTLHIQSANPFDDTSLSDRTVLIGATTTIDSLVPKDPKVFQAEMSAFAKTNQSPGSASKNIPPPDPFTRTPATVADIVAGSSVTVFAAENIKTLKTFSVNHILIQRKTPVSVK